MYKVKLEKFEGPLDLLLQLIEGADLDITEVAIADVAEQFMKYLELVEEKNPEELADFLVVASKLLLIKSRVLLPNLKIDAEDDGLNLATQLKIYKEYYEASKNIEKILAEKKVLFLRDKIPVDLEVIFNPPKDLNTEKLKKIFLEILKEIEPIIKLPQKSMLRAVSIKEKIESIRQRILAVASINFKDLIKGSKDKTDVIITFLGLLELVKQRVVLVEQNNLHDEIIIKKI
ncbi:MAG TPA: segregation/condensation protein A [bacterium]|nr:segregation/condensation protein A [bacterium]